MSNLHITVGDHELTGSWVEENPETRAAIEAELPLSGAATRWGDELYFSTPVDVPPEETQTEVPVGAVAYWPQGNAVCLFWGETPASRDDEPRAASPVSVVARIDDIAPLESLSGGATVEISER